MNKKMIQVVEGVVSLAIVASLYLVGVYVKPKEKIFHLEHPSIERRDRFFGIAEAVGKPGILWMAGKEGKIVRSEDGGHTWQMQASGTRENLQSVAAWDSKRAVAVGNTGLVLVTADGGITWRAVDSPKSAVDNKLLRVRIDPQGTAWAVGVMGTVLTSSDFGRTWERKVPEQDVAWNDVNFDGQGTVWVVGEFGHAMHTTQVGSKSVVVKAAGVVNQIGSDASQGLGISEEKKLTPPAGWVGVTMPTDRSLMTINFSDPQHAVVGGVEGTLLTTNDGGATWISVPLATKEHILDMTFAAGHWIGVGGRGLLLKGMANGTQWEVGRAQADDYAWHATVATFQDKLLIAGATLIEQDLKNLKVFSNEEAVAE
ncbi:YCF48-related protein [Rugosibacter aromaticivorans]|uniref:YCF48-related protein n=1 Tax=Rugosibacter aromaticivorans TaxID=1565605 RepID=UPI00192A38AA|nr:YCF48-related protein [Rugosibacter aromaticivorans]